MKSAILPAALFFISTTLAIPAFAEPPAGSLPLSEVLRSLEDQGLVSYFLEVQWDEEGYWDLRYIDAAGDPVEARLDPRTALPPV